MAGGHVLADGGRVGAVEEDGVVGVTDHVHLDTGSVNSLLHRRHAAIPGRNDHLGRK